MLKRGHVLKAFFCKDVNDSKTISKMIIKNVNNPDLYNKNNMMFQIYNQDEVRELKDKIENFKNKKYK